MKIAIEEKKKEALNRMKMLNLFPNVIREFEEKNVLNQSESGGILYWLSDEQKQYVTEFEAEHNALVYRACRYLGLDMTEEKNRFPHDFNRWHDIRINEYKTAKALKDEQERKKLYADFASIAEKYVGLQESKDGFAIVIARSPEDLIQEGKALHHCVGQMGYDQKFIKEETLIFFIRNSTDPDTPFVTMEYSLQSKKILQCYADHNSNPDETVLNFVRKKWLPYANRKVRAMQKTA